MNCVLCEKECKTTCRCGYCPDCLIWKTHRGCYEEMERKIENEKNKKTK